MDQQTVNKQNKIKSTLVLNCLFVFMGLVPREALLAANQRRAVCIYYDAAEENPSYRLGEIYAIMTQNLLGHFREVEPKVSSILTYQANDIGRCHSVVYLGSYYGTKIPLAFLQDVAKASQPLLWMNYNIWQLQDAMGAEAFKAKFGFTYDKMIGYRQAPTDERTPSFFQRFFYKQVEFTKYYRWDHLKKKPIASPEVVGIRVDGAKVLSYVKRNDSEETTPYITRRGNNFFVADIPYSFIHESDRYLIMTDILFDFLNLPPRHTKHYALIRIEDIHPLFFRDPLRRAISTVERHKVPYAMTIIPRFVDEMGAMDGKVYDQDMSQTPDFLKILKNAQANGASFLIHGYTHQVAGADGCSGVSGADYEFWDGCRGAALPFANRRWIRDRLDKAIGLFRQVGLDFVGWTTPHYEASQLTYKVVADVFPRTVQRARYMPMDVDASKDKITWTGQFFPYTIYRDFYGQFIWPENLGGLIVLDRSFNTPEDQKRYGHNQRTVADMKRSLKQMKVIRDSWASFFWHPQHITSGAGLNSLNEIIKAIREEGFEFVDLRNPPKDIQ